MKTPHPPLSWVSVVRFQWGYGEVYCIWYSDDRQDGFFLDGPFVRTFSTEADALRFLAPHPLPQGAVQKTVSYDTARIQRILRGAAPLDPAALLDFWNITGDLCRSLGRPFSGSPGDAVTDKIYDKLFWGNDLPAVGTSGRRYVPQFSHGERERLAAVMTEGIRLIEALPLPHP